MRQRKCLDEHSSDRHIDDTCCCLLRLRVRDCPSVRGVHPMAYRHFNTTSFPWNGESRNLMGNVSPMQEGYLEIQLNPSKFQENILAALQLL